MGTKIHYFFNARTVVPASIKKYKFAGYGQMCRIALKIPFLFLPVRRFTQATTIVSRGLRCLTILFIVPSLPAASLPSKMARSFRSGAAIPTMES